MAESSWLYEEREGIPGLRMTYAPEILRFFQARFEPLARFPDVAVERPYRVPEPTAV